MRKSCQRIALLARRNLTEILREPLSLIFMMALPLVMEVLFYFIFHNLTSQFEMRYLAPGIVAFAQTFLTLFTGLLIALDRTSAFLTRLYVSETRAYEFIFGYALALLPAALAQAVLFYLVGGILDASLFSPGMVWGLLLSLVTALLFIGLGILIGSLCGEKSVGGVASVVITGQSVLSGMWFPIETLGEGIVTFMRVLPFRNATVLLQNALNGMNNAWNDFWLPFVIVIGYTVVVFAFAVLAFQRNMTKE